MSRPQKSADKGSQYQLQRLVNDPSDPLGNELKRLISLETDEIITWVSPLASEGYVEYRDTAFLRKLGLRPADLSVPLAAFWPASGPRWDALAHTNKRRFILVEGKSHAPEMKSACTAVSPKSLAKIQRALEQTRAYCGASASDWSTNFYQYGNRLAHLYWLSQLNGVNAHLVFIYFVNDKSMREPTSIEAWRAEIDHVHSQLGLSSPPMPGYVHDLFVDVP